MNEYFGKRRDYQNLGEPGEFPEWSRANGLCRDHTGVTWLVEEWGTEYDKTVILTPHPEEQLRTLAWYGVSVVAVLLFFGQHRLTLAIA